MLFSFFIIDETSSMNWFEDSHVAVVEAGSEANAIKKYILGDDIHSMYIIALITNVLNFDLNPRQSHGSYLTSYNIANSLANKFEENTSKEIKDIDDDEYKQFIDKNLDEIVKLINEISSDRTYFYLKMVNVFLT